MIFCNLRRRPQIIPYLPPIKRYLRPNINLVHETLIIHGDPSLVKNLDKVRPYLQSSCFVKGRVVHGKLDAGFECFVECADAVGGEDEDAVVVLQHSEEDRDKSVACEVSDLPFFEEDVRFV